MTDNINTRQNYRELSANEKADIGNVKELGDIFIKTIGLLPTCRENSLAVTKIEEAIMWVTKGITK